MSNLAVASVMMSSRTCLPMLEYSTDWPDYAYVNSQLILKFKVLSHWTEHFKYVVCFQQMFDLTLFCLMYNGCVEDVELNDCEYAFPASALNSEYEHLRKTVAQSDR